MSAPRLLSLSILMCVAAACQRGSVPIVPDKVVGHCVYMNRFSGLEECRDYVGEWSEKDAAEDCEDQDSTVILGSACGVSERLGYCFLGGEDERWTRISFPGTDAQKCGSMKRGCELFGGGVFDPAPTCGGKEDQGGGDSGLPTFRQPVLTCMDPLPGEPPGQSAGGMVCTWEMISGATELGRSFEQYASCDRVRTQRPYYPVPPAPDAAREDARLRDPTYANEVKWVRSQIESTACVCCHSTRAPKGPSNWFVESPGNFINSFNPRGLAMGAGWIDTVGFGAYRPEHNNGFSRASPERPNDSIFVTTDAARIARFFEAELAHRGFTREDFTEDPYGAGPLDTQRFFRPEACDKGEGVGADGTLIWRGGKARYLYVLEADAPTPTVPPNLDLPEGTLWRIDVPEGGAPFESGTVRYGAIPQGLSQRFPAAGEPSALTHGKAYYLYVLADIIQPVTRCVFTYP
ncbi:hypothetical protein [Melittangium boletus]|uniref:Proteinase inhibitor n=1 Tax=Melittangium boletus DSM 14713 TaxID=1294270 RepID=A0A250IRE7_9BACT|nr:hypothetical protein [Melittangium boletus]ATB33757.1 hypothetical protein MEBOL_007255 [Melittangium boletus DSM 14713]